MMNRRVGVGQTIRIKKVLIRRSETGMSPRIPEVNIMPKIMN